MESGERGGLDRVEDRAGQGGQRVAVAGQVEQAELPCRAEAGRERVRLDVLVAERRGDFGGGQAVEPEAVDRLAQLQALGQADAGIARASLAPGATGGRRLVAGLRHGLPNGSRIGTARTLGGSARRAHPPRPHLFSISNSRAALFGGPRSPGSSWTKLLTISPPRAGPQRRFARPRDVILGSLGNRGGHFR